MEKLKIIACNLKTFNNDWIKKVWPWLEHKSAHASKSLENSNPWVFFLTRSLELELHFDEVLHTYLAGLVDDELIVVERVSSGGFNTCADTFPTGTTHPSGACRCQTQRTCTVSELGTKNLVSETAINIHPSLRKETTSVRPDSVRQHRKQHVRTENEPVRIRQNRKGHCQNREQFVQHQNQCWIREHIHQVCQCQPEHRTNISVSRQHREHSHHINVITEHICEAHHPEHRTCPSGLSEPQNTPVRVRATEYTCQSQSHRIHLSVSDLRIHLSLPEATCHVRTHPVSVITQNTPVSVITQNTPAKHTCQKAAVSARHSPEYLCQLCQYQKKAHIQQDFSVPDKKEQICQALSHTEPRTHLSGQSTSERTENTPTGDCQCQSEPITHPPGLSVSDRTNNTPISIRENQQHTCQCQTKTNNTPVSVRQNQQHIFQCQNHNTPVSVRQNNTPVSVRQNNTPVSIRQNNNTQSEPTTHLSASERTNNTQSEPTTHLSASDKTNNTPVSIRQNQQCTIRQHKQCTHWVCPSASHKNHTCPAICVSLQTVERNSQGFVCGWVWSDSTAAFDAVLATRQFVGRSSLRPTSR